MTKYRSRSPCKWGGTYSLTALFLRDLLTWVMCRPVSQIAGEIRGTVERAKYMLSIAESSLADVSLQDTDKPGLRRFIRRTPLGVVFVIAPWK